MTASKTETQRERFPVPVPFKDLKPGGELAVRLKKSFDRLEEEKYQPHKIFQPKEYAWPGDTEGHDER